MKLSKKIVAALLTMAMVIAQVSVLPFAETGTSNPYSSGYDDGAYYFFRVPNTTNKGEALATNSAGRTFAKSNSFGYTSFNGALGRDPETLEYKSSGVLFIEEFDGERFVELDIQENATTGKASDAYFTLSSKGYYNGQYYYGANKGLPDGIVGSELEAFAIRFKVTGEGVSGFNLRIEGDKTSPIYGYMNNLESCTFIDAKTNEVQQLSYGHPDPEKGGYCVYLDGEFDGWVIIPLTAGGGGKYDPAALATWFEESWQAVQVRPHSICSTHGASWSDWTDRKLYIGDSLFLTDIDKFMDVHAAPTTPEVDTMDDTTVSIKAVDGVIYSIAKTATPDEIIDSGESGAFTGLEGNTEYVITASWKDNHNAHKSRLKVTTHYTHPPLDAPTCIDGSITDGGFKIKVLPGLEYSIVGKDEWNDTGVFENLGPGKEYSVIGRSKKTHEETGVLKVTTVDIPNPYDRGDGSSAMFEVSDTATYYKPSYISEKLYQDKTPILNPDGTPALDEKGNPKYTYHGLKIVEENGERFVEIIQLTDTRVNFGVSGKELWGMESGIPRCIWLEDFWGFALRFKIDEGPADLYFYLRMLLPKAGDLPNDNIPYYTLDARTGEIKRLLKTDYWKMAGFDGWLLLPFESILKRSDTSLEGMQEAFDSISYYLNGPGGHPLATSWAEGPTKFYMGDAVVVEDFEKFAGTYGAPFNPTMKDKSDTHIAVNPVEGVTYAIAKASAPDTILATSDDGKFTGLEDKVEYIIYASWKDQHNSFVSSVNIVADDTPPYGTGYDDGAYYFFRVPNTDNVGNALPKNSAGRTYLKNNVLGYSSKLGHNLGVDPETLEYINNTKSVMFVEEEADGERFIEIKPDESRPGGDSTFDIYSGAYYDGAPYYSEQGIPDTIDASKLTAYAIRFKTTGKGASGFELRIGTKDTPLFGFMRGATEYTFIDANTREVSTITYGTPGNGYYTEGEMDGWIIVPFSAIGKDYDAAAATSWLDENWKGIGLWTHGNECTNHGGSWSDWTGRKLYLGDCMFLTDIDKFIDVHTAPAGPELAYKTDESIEIRAEKGVVYSITKADAPGTILASNETGLFTGLKEHTQYTIFAKWKDNHNTHVSQRTYVTDYTNPSLDAPTYSHLSDIDIQINVIPGLEYTIKDSKFSWTESGYFYGLAPNKKYVVIGRNKKTYEETAPLEFTTLALDNPYDRGDGSSTMFKVSDTDEYYKPSYINGNLFKYKTPKVDADGNPILDKDGNPTYTTHGLKIVEEEDGERLIEVIQETGEKANIGVSGKTLWGMNNGTPRNIWLENFWGYAFRLKIDEAPENLYFYMQIKMKSGNNGYANGWTYYLVDKETGTWSKHVKSDQWQLQGFDGWLIFPFSSMFKNPDFTYQSLQEQIDSFNLYLNGNTSQQGTVSWAEGPTKLHIGDAVVIEDIEKFMSVYAPNTTDPILPVPRNKVTDPSIPAVMANDATGNKVADGLYSLEKVRANKVIVNKPNEKSEGLFLNPGFTSSSIMFTNDALNFTVVPQDLYWQVLDSLGVTFYVEVPENVDGRVHFGVQILEDGTEYHNFGSMYNYFTISNGVAMERYGEIELKPGFKGYVMLPFMNFDFDAMSSESVDGMLNSPDTISYIGLTFDAETYPEMARSSLIVDDFMFYQSEDEFIKAIVKIQGGTSSEIVTEEQSFRLDQNPEFPRVMANDCTGIKEEEGIYAFDNVGLSLVDIKGTNDSYVNVTIGKRASSVMFENYAYYEGMDSEEYAELMSSDGIAFDISVPEDAPMIVGMDFEILEAETEYFLYDPNTYYYTVSNGEVYQVYGYLEFAPGFSGTVIIPFESFFFDELYSDYVDGQLTEFDYVDYFGFYFSTDYYASIADTTISIDNIAFYQGTYEYIDAVWGKQTGNGTIIPDKKPSSSTGNTNNNISGIGGSPITGEATPIFAVTGLMALSAAVVAFSRKRRKED